MADGLDCKLGLPRRQAQRGKPGWLVFTNAATSASIITDVAISRGEFTNDENKTGTRN